MDRNFGCFSDLKFRSIALKAHRYRSEFKPLGVIEIPFLMPAVRLWILGGSFYYKFKSRYHAYVADRAYVFEKRQIKILNLQACVHLNTLCSRATRLKPSIRSTDLNFNPA